MQNSVESSRRDFLRSSSTAAAVTLAAPAILIRESGFAANSDTLKVGLVGCGGRGTGAAANALRADPNIVITALADAFSDTIPKAQRSLQESFKDRVNVTPERQYAGLDSYRKLIDSDVDVVLLCSPPGFRPAHLRYAVEKGKQIFCEKPMATDGPGVRHVMESVRMSKEKKLNLLAGFCWRYDRPRQEFYRRLQDGAIGEIKHIYATYYTGPVKPMPAESDRPAEMGDLEWQVRNWYNFGWLSGDGLVEQAIHSVDKVAWAMRDVPPLKAVATGGRMVPNHSGNIYDHMTVVYEYENGIRGVVGQRQISGCYSENSDYVYGTKGNGIINGWSDPVLRGDTAWRWQGKKSDMYDNEHQDFFASIRAGKILNDGDRMATSTLMGILGRMAAYTGQQVTWEEALNSKVSLGPEALTLGPYSHDVSMGMKLRVAPIAIPGRYKI